MRDRARWDQWADRPIHCPREIYRAWPVPSAFFVFDGMSSQPSLIHRTAVLVYGVISYGFFFATFLYAIGFVGDLFVPRTIDSAPSHRIGFALLIDAALLGVFALQHSVMARPAFKRVLTRFIPESAERSTYVLMSSLALILFFRFWEPIGGVV